MDQQLIEEKLKCCPVAFQAHINPTLIAIQTEDRQISFAELNSRITHLSFQLIKLNMKEGDRLVSIAQNSLPLILLQLVCIRNGFIFCPINPKFSQGEIQQRLTLLNSPFIWQAGGKNSFCLDFEATSKQINNQATIRIDAQAVVSIIFTSGSSGFPKAVMHNFSNHYYSALGSQAVIALKEGDNNLLSLPLFHISGYATVMRTLLAGATLQLSNEQMNVSLLKTNNITHLSLVCSQLQKLLLDEKFKASLLSIKHLLLGGSAFPTKILQQTEKRGFTYHLSYGSTEMASQVATSTNNDILQLLPYRQLKIHKHEILIAGETRFVGYFKANQQSNLIDKNSYFCSSDLGELNANSLRIIGRKDRQFISGGENIQPEEIEKVLLTFPGVSQAYVLALDDNNYGQRPIAFINWDKNQQVTKLKDFIQDKLITYKQPQHYFLLPEQQGLKPNPKQLTDIALKLILLN